MRHKLLQGKSEEKAAEALVKRAREKGSHDDCSAAVVRFAWAFKVETKEEEEAQEMEARGSDASN